jgi:hypothetical protein
MSQTTLRRLLRERFDAGCDAAGIDAELRHYQGAEFTPPDPVTLYARETLISGAEVAYAIGSGPLMETRAIYQVDVYAPAGVGTRDIDDAVEAVRAEFRPGSQAHEDGVFLSIDAASVLGITQSNRVLQCPLSITYRAHRAA